MATGIDAAAEQGRSRAGWAGEFIAGLALGWPLVAAQIAQNALFTTDVIMMGWLGPRYLAAGSLATAFVNTWSSSRRASNRYPAVVKWSPSFE